MGICTSTCTCSRDLPYRKELLTTGWDPRVWLRSLGTGRAVCNCVCCTRAQFLNGSMSWREGEERRAFLVSKWEALEREEKLLEEGRCELAKSWRDVEKRQQDLKKKQDAYVSSQ